MLALVGLAAVSAASADDVVHFANGTFMKVQGYTVEGDMVKVTLGPGATMSFPKTLVESIERAGRTVYPQTPAGTANVVVGGTAGGQVSNGPYVQRGEEQLPARRRAAAAPPTTEAGSADSKDAASRQSLTDFQMAGRRGVLRAVGRQGTIGEGLVEKDPHAPPPQVTRPRSFATLAPRGMSQATSVPTDPPPSPAPGDAAPPEGVPVETPDEGGDEG
jgi:hypothetical protein